MEKSKGKILYTVTVPSNCSATLFVGGNYAVKCKEVKLADLSKEKEGIVLATGTYHFEIKNK